MKIRYETRMKNKRGSDQNIPGRLFGSGVTFETLKENKYLRICKP